METNIDKILNDKPPRTDFWCLFKVASYERLIDMQKGTLYMNSLEYFSTLKSEESLALRMDKLEKVQSILRAEHNDEGFSTLSVKLGHSEKEIALGSDAYIKAVFPHPNNTMIFCMGALADGQDGLIPGEVEDTILFDKRFLEFGSHLLLIGQPLEFSKRINKAISKDGGIYGSKYFHGGIGIVDYKPLSNYSGPIGLYTKDLAYSWQMEFRICFGVETHRLNAKGAYELNIGDISDISDIIPVQALIDEPLKVKRRTFTKVDGEYKQING